MFVLELGGDDDRFAAAEACAAASDVRVVAPGLAVAASVDRERFRGLAYAHRASELLGEPDAAFVDPDANLDDPDANLDATEDASVPVDASIDAAVDALRTASVDRNGTVAVRAVDVRGTAGVDTQQAERELGAVLVDRGFSVDLDDPDHELRVLFSDGGCYLGWLAAESVRDYGDRQPTDRAFFQPGSMDPLLARAVCNLARVEPGDRVLDPMCGTGGVLLEAGLLGARPLGTDAQAKMVRGTRKNLDAVLGDADHAAFDVALADATRLPFRDDSVDAAVFDAPYGRQSKIETHDLASLVEGALAEARRVAGRCVLVADRDWRNAADAAGWTVAERFERRVHRSLTRYVLVLA